MVAGSIPARPTIKGRFRHYPESSKRKIRDFFCENLASGFKPEKQAVFDHTRQFLSSMQRIGRKN
jgi:hypothetical protein